MIGALTHPDRSADTSPVAAGGYGSLRRGLEIVALVQDRGRITVAELADATGLPLSTAYRYVAALRDTGFVVDDDGHLVPGTRMAEPSDENTHLIGVARPIARRLRDLTDLTVLIVVRVHTMALCLDWAPSRRGHRIFFGRGQIRPIAAGGSALPLLAFAPKHVIDMVLRRIVRGPTAASPTAEQLATLLPRIREEQVSVSRGHITPGLVSIGVPVLVSGRCLCAISLVGEESELAGPLLDRRIEQVQAAAEQMVAALPDATAREEWSHADG